MAMTLQNDMAQSLADELKNHIDKEIMDGFMTDILVKEGWIKTKINPAYSGSIAPEIDWYAETAEWIHVNAKGEYKLLKGQWLFKDPKDATMFILRWS